MKMRNLIIIAAILSFPLVALAITKNSEAYQASHDIGNLLVKVLKVGGIAAIVVFGVRYIVKEE